MTYHIIGGGPVGLSLALLLAKQNKRSVVYEGRLEIVQNIDESYPIGVNARGLHTLKQIDEKLAQSVLDTGKMVNSWQIYGGKQMVAEQLSGTVLGTSRGKVNILLYEAVLL